MYSKRKIEDLMIGKDWREAGHIIREGKSFVFSQE
jgi:hypothetical protein